MKLFHAKIRWVDSDGPGESPDLLAYCKSEQEFREIITRVEPIKDDMLANDMDRMRYFPPEFAPFHTKELFNAAHCVSVTEITTLTQLMEFFPQVHGKEFHIVETSGW